MSKNKRVMLYSAVFALIVALVLATGASAGQWHWPWSPENVDIYHVEGPDGEVDMWCKTDMRDGQPWTECYPLPVCCGCEFSPNGENPVPSETPKPQCNRGTAGGAEGCDPGNSGGKPGNAGEDHGK